MYIASQNFRARYTDTAERGARRVTHVRVHRYTHTHTQTRVDAAPVAMVCVNESIHVVYTHKHTQTRVDSASVCMVWFHPSGAT